MSNFNFSQDSMSIVRKSTNKASTTRLPYSYNRWTHKIPPIGSSTLYHAWSANWRREAVQKVAHHLHHCFWTQTSSNNISYSLCSLNIADLRFSPAFSFVALSIHYECWEPLRHVFEGKEGKSSWLRGMRVGCGIRLFVESRPWALTVEKQELISEMYARAAQ